MIKINLLPQRKPKRQQEPGQRDLGIGVLFLLLAGFATFMFVHKPYKEELEKLRASNAELDDGLQRRKDKISDLVNLRTAVTETDIQSESIKKLNGARAIPAHMLHELGEILTPGGALTMTKEMAANVSNPNNDTYRLREDWDPKHVWITEFVEKQGMFNLIGGAESDGDITQLSKRLQASAYFKDVAPIGAEKVTDKNSGVTHYTFVITGRVVY